MKKLPFRTRFKKGLGPLLWFLGMALIVYYSPPKYRFLPLLEGEKIVGFRGRSHELYTVKCPIASASARWQQQQPAWVLFDLFPGRLMTARYEPPADTVFAWDVEVLAKRRTDLGQAGSICQMATCPESNRVCILYRVPGKPVKLQLTVVDASAERVIRSYDWRDPAPPRWNISNDGQRLSYGGENGTVCLDVDSDRVLSRTNSPSGLSTDGNFFIFESEHGAAFVDLQRQARIDTGSACAGADSFSPDRSKFIDSSGHLWDIADHQAICRTDEHLYSGGTFADGGRTIAWIEHVGGGLEVRWRDLISHYDLNDRSIWIPQKVAHIEAVDVEGNLLMVQAFSDPTGPTWTQKALSWLGIKAGPVSGIRQEWLLIDGTSGQVLERGKDELLAISRDGRYVVTGDDNASRARVYELPLRRSLLFMAIASGAWTGLVFVIRRWWRRRVTAEGDEIGECLAQASNVATAGTP